MGVPAVCESARAQRERDSAQRLAKLLDGGSRLIVRIPGRASEKFTGPSHYVWQVGSTDVGRQVFWHWVSRGWLEIGSTSHVLRRRSYYLTDTGRRALDALAP